MKRSIESVSADSQQNESKKSKTILGDLGNKRQPRLLRNDKHFRATINLNEVNSTFDDEWSQLKEIFKNAKPNLNVHHMQHAILFAITKNYDFAPRYEINLDKKLE